ncbi:MAG: aldehyde ferredoxin oxidoreductase family protein [Thermoplasmatota archaeon]
MSGFGYHGKLLRSDLTEKEFSEEKLSKDFLKKYIGGAGFTTRLLYDEVGPGVEPFSPKNKIIIAPGLFVGTGIPRGSKTAFGFKSPLTGGYGKSIVGGWIGAKLKKAGYDVLIIEGKAVEPTLIHIENDKVKFVDASDLWGLKTGETRRKIIDDYEGFRTAVIGPAGEKLSNIATIDCNERQVGRGGAGAVMGSKNLKAIAVNGNKKIEFYNEDKLKEMKRSAISETREKSESYMIYGTGGHLQQMNTEKGAFPVRNFQSNYFKKAYDELDKSSEDFIDIDPKNWVNKYQDGVRPCPMCPAPCSIYFKADKSPYGRIGVDGPEYETQYSFGGCTEVNDIKAVAKANELCDQYGLDTISAGVTISWAMEAYEKGLFDIEDLELDFGNARAMIETVERMGKKEGEIGELLINGVKEASENLGKGSDKFAIHVKGMEPAGYDPRGMFGMGLAFAVAPRGADHLTSSEYVLDFSGEFWNFKGYDRYNIKSKALPTKMMEDLMILYDMTGACKFSRGILEDKGLLDFINVITGWDLSMSEMMVAGERAFNISKAYNVREGLGREEDVLPERLLTEATNEGPSKDRKITRKNFESALDKYYDIRGWNEEGIPTMSILKKLDLPKIAEEIGAWN